jgi:transposase
MKKNSTTKKNNETVKQAKSNKKELTIGMDLGDKYSHLCVLDTQEGEELERAQVPTKPKSIERWFVSKAPATVALEVGTDSGWVSRLLTQLGHEVLVADARKVRQLAGTEKKHDQLDAEFLARICRVDRNLLHPIKLRDEHTQLQLATIRTRDKLVQARTMMINAVRGMVKTVGVRMPKCSAESFHKQAKQIPEKLREALTPMMTSVENVTEQIRCCDKLIERKSEQQYPQTKQLSQVAGVGLITALAYVLIIEDPNRFAKSRDVGAYLGMTRPRYQSGESDPQLRISKQGDALLRRLLVNSAHYILGPFAPDSDLRRWGLKYAAGGGKNAKKRAVVAVARKLAVLLHALWKSGDKYEPLRNARLRDEHVLQQATIENICVDAA